VGRVAAELPAQPDRSLIITCEHATNRLPARYRNLGLRPEAMASHIAWDRGARQVARYCARQFGCPYHEGKYSRLLIDLNRSPHHPKLIPPIAFGQCVPGNAGLSREEKRDRFDRYYRPYREAVIRDIERILAVKGTCMHISAHSFTPRLGKNPRRADIGILYDPARKLELEFAERLVTALREYGFDVRRNYPYRGTADGLTKFCRRLFAGRPYLGIELEINQRVLYPIVTPELRRSLKTAIERALTT
jgi:predicted N-formylglutamate amidohydrolase